MKAYNAVVQMLKKVYPHFERALTSEESVTAVLDVINKATMKDTGAFVSHKGNKEWL